MNPTAATNLIAQTFDSRFDESAFENFVGNLLNKVDRSKAFGPRSGNMIPQAFRGHISTYRRPFVYTDPTGERLDVLIVRLDKSHGLDRARTMQRNFAAWYLKQDHETTVEAALIAFYHEDVPDWRFSLVRLEYTFADEGVAAKLTPARRYSFLVGPTEPTHTAESQLRPFLIEDTVNPTIDSLAQAFQIEVISRRFFEEYKELFLQLVESIETLLRNDKGLADDFRRADIFVPNFAKKLLGQIVFLYFVQKKGWLGVPVEGDYGTGRKDFLRTLFDQKNGVSYRNFFNDLLEPFFYEALAIRRPGDSYSLGNWTCKIPFLNGGLFEPMGGYDWQHTRLFLPNNLFSNRQNADDDKGTGILDVFDRYNFTVQEEEPLEKEVAVDPEMLGKVFQELLEVHERKSKGAIYTPREIVHYMCQESLINYLDTSLNLVETPLAQEKPVQAQIFGATPPQQKAIRTTTRVERVPRDDIAILVRQGALALQQDAAKEAGLKSGDYVLPQRVRDFARELDNALATIKLCDPAIGSGAFPVGMLHEIVQARLALDTQLKRKPTPYQLKRHAIQESIYGVDIDAGAVEIAKLRLWLSLVVDEESYENIQPLPNLDYKIVCGNSLLRVEKNLLNLHLFNRLDSLKQQYFAETHRQEKARLKTQIDQLIELLTGDKTTFDFEVHFHEVFAGRGGFDVVIGNPPYSIIGSDRSSEQQYYKKLYELTSYKMNTYVLFLERGLNLLGKNQAILSYIIPKSLVFNTYFKKTRAQLLNKYAINQIIEIREKVFEDAEVGDSILFFASNNVSPLQNLLNYYIVSNIYPHLLVERHFSSEQKDLLNSSAASFYQDSLQVKVPVTPLSQLTQISNGLNPGNVRHILLASNRESVNHKKMVLGRDIQRYYLTWSGTWVNYDPSLKVNLTPIDIRSKKGMTAQKKVDFALRQPDIYLSPKLLVRKTADHIVATYDAHGFYFDTLAYSIRLRDKTNISLLYILGLLNSKLMVYIHNSFSKNKGKVFAKVLAENLGRLPICNIESTNQANHDTIVQLVTDSLNQKEANPANDILGIEAKIDQLVYELYNLTPAEIALIEESTR